MGRTTNEPRGQELITRYKVNYGISPDEHITERMILEHWELEKALAEELRNSSPGRRRETFEKCYTELYSRLEWLNRPPGAGDESESAYDLMDWAYLVGRSGQKVYEIGSGSGRLISYLAGRGHACKGAEITPERGDKLAPGNENLAWGRSDGVHLEMFEPPDHYDVVISSQVIEHLHPDSIVDHFKGAYRILKPGGRYIFNTPHAFFGPSDVSRVFNCEECRGMHLKEYTYSEVAPLLKAAGFREICIALRLPRKIKRLLGPPGGSILRRVLNPKVSRAYLSYMCALERLFNPIPSRPLRKKAASLAICILFYRTVFIVAKK